MPTALAGIEFGLGLGDRVDLVLAVLSILIGHVQKKPTPSTIIV